MLMHNDLKKKLISIRKKRNFDTELYIKAKMQDLNKYFTNFGIRSCVVGISGGIDSAVTLAILNKTRLQKNSPLEEIIPVTLPFYGQDGATNQVSATKKALRLMSFFNIKPRTVDFTKTHETLIQSIDSIFNTTSTSWSKGQLVSNLRTPILYHIATLQFQKGVPAVVCGTTNRDEGAYIGFFGKASDIMTDIQVISDIHKSEVYLLAKYFQLPLEIIDAIPHGDVYNGDSDQDLIGVHYNFVELYLNYLNMQEGLKKLFNDSLSSKAQREWKQAIVCLEKLHAKNKHKYISGTTAIHCDVMERCVSDGWMDVDLQFKCEKLEKDKFNALFNINSSHFKLRLDYPKIKPIAISDYNESAVKINTLLSDEEANNILKQAYNNNRVPVSECGYFIDKAASKVGSYRNTFHDSRLAQCLFDRLKQVLPPIKIVNDFTPTNHTDCSTWQLIGVNPLFRVIFYKKNGHIVPHYDSSFYPQNSDQQSLKSLIICITKVPKGVGGKLRFYLDVQRHLEVSKRNFEDLISNEKSYNILAELDVGLGDAVCFDHRILHDVTPYVGESERVVIRTDILYQKSFLEKAVSYKIQGAFRSEERACSLDKISNKVVKSIKEDPFYESILEKFSDFGLVFKAGYLQEKYPYFSKESLQSNNFLVTPIHKIQNNINHKSSSKEYVVLLTTGGFNPLHQGHINMMENAKSELEKDGFEVLGGYFSPGHDIYISEKGSFHKLNIIDRLEYCRKLISESDWLMVDPWEGLYNKAPVNFTTVIQRLSAYLSFNVLTAKTIHVAYVFGSDNAYFSYAFNKRGISVCISRPGFEKQFLEVKNDTRLLKCKNTYFVSPKNCNALSSRTLAPEVFKQIADNNKSVYKDGFLLILRNDLTWATQRFNKQVQKKDLEKRISVFREKLICAIEKYFGLGELLKIETMQIDEQKTIISKHCQNKPIISLDPCVKKEVNLGVSRYYNLFSDENTFKISHRPGYKSLISQIKEIKKDHIYFLLDDDSYTGTTISFVQNMLKKNDVKVDSFITTVQSQNKLRKSNFNLCDLRDFLVGSKEGGLVCNLREEIVTRCPYILPYVKPSNRFSLPVHKDKEFSKVIWELNFQFYDGLEIYLKDFFKFSQSLYKHIGFTNNTSASEICEWHIKQFKDR